MTKRNQNLLYAVIVALCLLVLVMCGRTVLGDEPIMLNTKDHKVTTPTTIDFSTATLLGLPATPASNGLPTGGTAGQYLQKKSTTNYDTQWITLTLPVTSVFGRTGAVVAASGDYTAAQVTNAADITASNTFTQPQFAPSLEGTNTSRKWFLGNYPGAPNSYWGLWPSTSAAETLTNWNLLWDGANFRVGSTGEVQISISNVNTVRVQSYKVSIGAGIAPIANTNLTIQPANDSYAGIRVKANSATQSGNLQEWQNSSGAVISSVSPQGILSGSGAVPAGGTLGQVFTKNSNTDYDAGWATPAGGSVPGGSPGQLQYNNAGALNGAAALSYATSGTLLTDTAQAATDIPLVLKGATSQTANMFQIQNSLGAVGFSFSLTANTLQIGGASGLILQGTNVTVPVNGDVRAAGFGAFTVTNATAATSAATKVPLTVKGFASQSANLQEWRDSGGTSLSSVTAAGAFNGPGAVPAGGITGQALTKNTNTDYDVGWATPAGGGGTGTVTSFSAGDLSPLFTTTEATVTTTPALSFVLSNAAANSWFGNATASSAAPAYNGAAALTETDDTNVTLALGGTPATALLKSVSMTLGWTGTLSQARGGFGANITSVAANTVYGNPAGISGAPSFTSSPRFTAIANLTSNGFVKTGSSNGTLSVDTSTYLTGNQTITLTGDATGSGTTSIATTVAAKLPTGGTTGQVLTKTSATNYAASWQTPATVPVLLINSSVANQTGFATDTYVTGSNIIYTAGQWAVGGTYHCTLEVSKTAAGTATPIVTLRAGTTGTTSDAAEVAFTFTAGTAATDDATIEVFATIRTTGASGTGAGACKIVTSGGGFIGGTTAWTQVKSSTSVTWDTTTFTNIGVSLNGGTGFQGTVRLVSAEYKQ
jgi:hypothetical protein